MSEPTTAEKLGIEPNTLVWIIGDSIEETALLDPLPAGVETYEDDSDQAEENWSDDTWTGTEDHDDVPEPQKPSGIDSAFIAVSNSQEFHMRLDDVLPALGSVGRVWVIYPQDELSLIIVQNGVDEYGWNTGTPITLDETWSAVELGQP